MKSLYALLLITLLTFTNAAADLRLPTLFSDHMVLQRDRENLVWGWADANETVTVEFDGDSVSTTSNNVGSWVVRIPARPVGAPKTLTVRANDTITIKDILMGDVWVCSGQSNMQWTVDRANNVDEEVANANYPDIRYYFAPLRVALEPQSDIEGEWKLTSPEVVAQFSAVAYFFGRTVHEKLDVPIGLISTSWGGTAIESWTSQDATALSETFAELNNEWQPDVKEHGDLLLRHYQGDKPELPKMNRGVGGAPNVPSFNYNAMIAPLWQYGIKGAIWYQGESNESRAYQYRDLMQTMIRDWRVHFGQGDFPFFITQLANYRKRNPEPARSQWAEVREAQLMATALPKVGMAVAIDIGDADDIHPKNKQEVGRRLAQSAFNIAYGMDVVPSGPVYTEMNKGRKKITLRFDHTARGLETPDDATLTGFQIADDSKQWVWAEAKIRGKKVIVRSPDVKRPVAVRYGWADNPDCNLYNSEGFPATPFRTDDWRVSTQNRK